jgi:hypothetical protein
MFAPSRDKYPSSIRRYQGGWINFAIAAAGALLSKKSSDKAGKAAQGDRARELDLEERGLEIAERQDERAGELFGHYRDTFLPAERKFVSEAFDRPISPAAAERRSLADVRGAFVNAREIEDRDRRRLGINPSSGASLALDRTRSLEEAKIEGAARTRAREGTRDRNFGRQATALGYGSPTAAYPFSSAAQTGVDNAASLAGMRSRRSDEFAYQAGAAYGANVNDLIDTGLEAWRNKREQREEAA